jgi:acetyl esterase/lipase
MAPRKEADMADRAFTVEDVEYLRHGEEGLLARVFLPEGEGPFPCIVEVHGGGWSQFDRLRGKNLHEALARSGVTVVSPEGAYPKSVADVHYGIRWVKANAAKLKTRPDLVGASGNSSGGHQAMLISMRPDDARYAAIPLPPGSPDVDARLRCLVMLWPVINPLGRYRYAKTLLTGAEDAPKWPKGIVKMQDGYWGDEATMAEGNPMLMLERGERVELTPALWVQATQDKVHNYKDPDTDFPGTEVERFAARYTAAGGDIKTLYFDAPMMFTTAHGELPESIAALKAVADFVHQHIPTPAKV